MSTMDMCLRTNFLELMVFFLFLFSILTNFPWEGRKKAMTLKVIFIMSIFTCLNLVLLSLALYHKCSSLKLVYISPNNAYGGDVVRPMNAHMGSFSQKFMCLLMEISKLLTRISNFQRLFSTTFWICEHCMHGIDLIYTNW